MTETLQPTRERKKEKKKGLTERNFGSEEKREKNRRPRNCRRCFFPAIRSTSKPTFRSDASGGEERTSSDPSCWCLWCGSGGCREKECVRSKSRRHSSFTARGYPSDEADQLTTLRWSEGASSWFRGWVCIHTDTHTQTHINTHVTRKRTETDGNRWKPTDTLLHEQATHQHTRNCTKRTWGLRIPCFSFEMSLGLPFAKGSEAINGEASLHVFKATCRHENF